MKEVKGQHIVVAGAARSGVAAAVLLKNRGADVFVSDAGTIATNMSRRLSSANIPFEQKGHTSQAMQGDFLVISPGIPSDSAIAKKYLESGKKIYSEVEIASWFNQNKMIAVTGSNGKTTVVNWMSHLWSLAGKNHRVAGNIGTAFSEQTELSTPGEDMLLEISSFQLDHIDSFRPSISMILNITPDHLDRYEQQFDKYARAKQKITTNQKNDDWFIYNADDPIVRDFAESLSKKEHSPQMLAFSLEREPEQGIYQKNNQLILNIKQQKQILMAATDIGLPGRHNLRNGMATALAARASEIENEFIRESLKTFEGVEHRLEKVRNLDGVLYVNDSKATNINSVWYALQSFDNPVVLILGGRDKGNDYRKLEDQIHEKVHTIITIGEAREMIKNQLSDIVPYLLEADTLKEAVKKAREKAKRGEVVLLSPACSSFDMFENYEDRGNQFKQAVIDL